MHQLLLTFLTSFMTSTQSFSDIFMSEVNFLEQNLTDCCTKHNFKKMTWVKLDYVLWSKGVLLFPLISSDTALSAVIYDYVIYRIY